jgi:hypothetical protein
MHVQRSAVLALTLLLPMLGAAQSPQSPEPKFPSLAALHGDAVESVNITLGPTALGFARLMSRFEGASDPEAQTVLQGLHMVQVHSFQFTSEPDHAQKDLEVLRSQLTAPGWNHLVEVRSSPEQKNVDVYMSVEGGRINGMVVIASQPRELTIVNIDGVIDLQKLHQIEGKFGVPRLR